MNKMVVGGSHVAVDDDATADAVSIVTGASGGFQVQVFRSGVNIGLDVKASLTDGVLKIEDGSTYKITTGDVINWIVF